jgi:tyrosyl-tRNA synthetase
MTVLDDLSWRGVVSQASDGLATLLATSRVKAYVGFDPSAASLHVGSLLPVMNLVRLQRAGHTPIAILGGGTGMIGDPSGKTAERQLLSQLQIAKNLEGIRTQLERFLDFQSGENAALLINNADWLLPIDLLSFLRDVGKYFTVNYMLAKESVRRRLESESGISFTEFSYMLLQAYDFLVLFDRHGCELQMGGSDQWGNIVAGIELIRRLRAKAAHGLVFPLVTTASGIKFGKTEAGTIWLDPNLTSPYHFYQFWLGTDDRDVIPYLKYFTLRDRRNIDELAAITEHRASQREAQRTLARDVTRAVHGDDALSRAESATTVLFGGEIAGLRATDIEEIFHDVRTADQAIATFQSPGRPLIDSAVDAGIVSSKAEARRLIEGGGFYVNNRRITDSRAIVTVHDAIEGKYIVFRKGAKDYLVVRLT